MNNTAPAVNDYNTAQFDLYRALGQPAQWVTLGQWQPPASPPEGNRATSTAAEGNGAPARP